MKEALMTIASAWATAFIVLFLLFITADIHPRPDIARSLALIKFCLLVGSVTGAGWLWARHEMKAKRRPDAQA